MADLEERITAAEAAATDASIAHADELAAITARADEADRCAAATEQAEAVSKAQADTLTAVVEAIRPREVDKAA
ncbi:hypothetical protein [Rhodococcus globerulus]|uniref:hypothetical protein n=1 Tax=Rhodococcus globerulus TaxID=33008 RepID=UPI003019C449